jgi:hypothetical protein
MMVRVPPMPGKFSLHSTDECYALALQIQAKIKHLSDTWASPPSCFGILLDLSLIRVRRKKKNAHSFQIL